MVPLPSTPVSAVYICSSEIGSTLSNLFGGGSSDADTMEEPSTEQMTGEGLEDGNTESDEQREEGEEGQKAGEREDGEEREGEEGEKGDDEESENEENDLEEGVDEEGEVEDVLEGDLYVFIVSMNVSQQYIYRGR